LSYQDGQKWIFPVCPWNPDHTNRSAVIIQFANGAISASCRHDGCAGKRWQGLRDQFEPGWREKKSQQTKADHSTTNASGDGKPKHGFTIQSAKDVLESEDSETEWLLDGILPIGGTSLIVSKPKVGKTTLAFNLAVAVAQGIDFL